MEQEVSEASSDLTEDDSEDDSDGMPDLISSDEYDDSTVVYDDDSDFSSGSDSDDEFDDMMLDFGTVEDLIKIGNFVDDGEDGLETLNEEVSGKCSNSYSESLNEEESIPFVASSPCTSGV